MEGLKLALGDYRLYLFVLIQHASLLSQTFQYFFPAIVGTLGYGSIDTLWLTAPVWVRPRCPIQTVSDYATRECTANVGETVCNIPLLYPRDVDIIHDG